MTMPNGEPLPTNGSHHVPDVDDLTAPEDLVDAATAVSELLARLSSAAQRPETVPCPPDLAAVLLCLHASAQHLPQLFERLAIRLGTHSRRDDLFTTDRRPPGEVVGEVAGDLHDAQHYAKQLVAAVGRAAGGVANLGVHA